MLGKIKKKVEGEGAFLRYNIHTPLHTDAKHANVQTILQYDMCQYKKWIDSENLRLINLAYTSTINRLQYKPF